MTVKTILSILIIFSGLFLFSTCQKPERDNPWDEKANLNPNEWTAKSLQLEDLTITSKKLAWVYDGDDRIEGFKIDRKKGNENWEDDYFIADKSTRTWIDDHIIPDTLNTYTYRLFTIAGENRSSERTVSFNANFPAPSNLKIEKLTDISNKLTWNDNSKGEQGFKIDRRLNNGEWETAIGVVPADQNTFTDANVFAQSSSSSTHSTIPLDYRVYAYYATNETKMIATNTDVSLTPPAKLQIKVNSNSSVTLNWEYATTGNQGFKIDRKLGSGNWQEAFGTVNQSQKTFNDNSVNLSNNDYYYRVYSYYEKYISSFLADSIAFPTVTTTMPTKITMTSAISGGKVTKGTNITSRGLVWSITQNPTIESNQNFTANGSGAGEFSSNLTGLSPNTNYFIRAYAANNVGTSYGSQLSFKTQDGIIQLTTRPVLNITATSAILGGTMTSDGGGRVTTQGVVWSTNQNPTIDSNEGIKSDNAGSGFFGTGYWEFNITGLLTNTTYFVQAYATSNFGTNYGTQLSFTTINDKPQFAKSYVYNVDGTSAQFEGNISSNGGTAVIARGVCWSTSTGPTVNLLSKTVDGSGVGNFKSNLTGLQKGTKYYLRPYATNSAGTSYGEELNLTTWEHSVGEIYAGGIIFYLDYTGKHGLVCAQTDQSSSAEWGCNYTEMTGADGKDVGTGNQNTIDIVKGCTTVGIAAKICYDLSLNGYEDWFLPSFDELYLLFDNLHVNYLGSFSNNYYWSSSESESINSYAYIGNFSAPLNHQWNPNTMFEQIMGKDKKYRVRAIRAF